MLLNKKKKKKIKKEQQQNDGTTKQDFKNGGPNFKNGGSQRNFDSIDYCDSCSWNDGRIGRDWIG
jgi:hypothetical protein